MDNFAVWVTIQDALEKLTTSSSRDESARLEALELAKKEVAKAYESIFETPSVKSELQVKQAESYYLRRK